MTGTVGFRPTTGCWNAGDGIVPMTVSRDTVGASLSHASSAPHVLGHRRMSVMKRMFTCVMPSVLRSLCCESGVCHDDYTACSESS